MSGKHGSDVLIVLVADLDIEQAIRGLLSRPHRIRIGNVTFDVRRHPNRDPGCRTQAAEYLRPFVGRYQRSMVVFDLHGSGSTVSREETQQAVEHQLGTNGWSKRSKAVVIEPELEAWVWTRSSHVSRALGWESRYDQLRAWLESQGLWPSEFPKPLDPKRAMQRAMERAALRKRVRRSPTKFHDLAQRIDSGSCRDPAFSEMRATLRDWFPPSVGATT